MKVWTRLHKVIFELELKRYIQFPQVEKRQRGESGEGNGNYKDTEVSKKVANVEKDTWLMVAVS